MNAAHPAGSPSHRPPGADANVGRWAELLAEMSALHARLEYMRLMLRLQQGNLPPPDAGA